MDHLELIELYKPFDLDGSETGGSGSITCGAGLWDITYEEEEDRRRISRTLPRGSGYRRSLRNTR